MSEQVKNCVRCGQVPNDWFESDGCQYVMCLNEKCADFEIQYGIADWQSRPLEDALSAENEKLRKALSSIFADYGDEDEKMFRRRVWRLVDSLGLINHPSDESEPEQEALK